MRVLILGITGMLGHKLFEVFSANSQFETFGSIRGDRDQLKNYPRLAKLNTDKVIAKVDSSDINSISQAFEICKPDVVINAIGIVKSISGEHFREQMIEINSLFPHQLQSICASQQNKTKLIHISTDCVFAGLKGMYSESDIPDASDIYGRSKLLGEVDYQNALTLRTSIIGSELSNQHGLFEWFFAQSGKSVEGYKNAIFSGFTTNRLARVLLWIIKEHHDLCGMYHLAAPSINKFELLQKLKTALKLDIEITENSKFKIDRSLDCTNFIAKTGFVKPTWNDMIDEFADDFNKHKELPC